MTKQVLKGRIEFTDETNKEFDRDFTATLDESVSSEYGNGTCLVIKFGKMQNGRIPENKYVDTRYAKGIVENFKGWVELYFKVNFLEHTLIFED